MTWCPQDPLLVPSLQYPTSPQLLLLLGWAAHAHTPPPPAYDPGLSFWQVIPSKSPVGRPRAAQNSGRREPLDNTTAPHLLRKLPCTSQCYHCRNQASVAHSNNHGARTHLSLDFLIPVSLSPPSWGPFFPQTNHLPPSPHRRLGF